ncbi:LytR family transcriptional regulator [Cryobacterium frigoriphilum]|uniref:LytR family transcriptional regulator n=1 Tax=Cryobacterium frigoriphilum TaxID=1259150 RepID=A0A4R8ZX85_9MICO|nr:LytR C-terminal domain-containing protein [Cryobacterium frigoriphilum]TFD48350.1 LytR family transcriptional regulator [Cryobacterium frigoriphilum]
MARTYPHDRFDDLSHGNRVGAHRAPAKKGRGWVPFWWALGATLLLIGIGIVILVTLTNRLSFTIPGLPTDAATSAPTSEAVPTAVPTVDPTLSVTVLNGTPDGELAASVTEILTIAGWDVGSTQESDADGVETTFVYYSDPVLEGAARGVAASLPGSELTLSDDFAETGASITVIVGNDYLAAQG